MVPVIVTVVPLSAFVGVKLVIVGAGKKTKPVNVGAPTGVVTKTLPVVPLATTAVICVGLFTTNEVAAVPPKLTAVAPVKKVPLITTV